MTDLRLALALTCLSLSQVGCLGAACDPDRQYSNHGQCCDFCPPGHFVQKHCSKNYGTICAPCSSGTYSEVSDNLNSCRKCRHCPQVTVRACSITQNANCSCHEGFLCTSSECDNCRKKEICPRGQELTRTGDHVYAFQCEPCSEGMYCDIDGGDCKFLTRCDQLGLETIFPGNKTHNSACSKPGLARELDKSPVNTEAILVATLVLCVFTSLVVLVKTCMFKAACRKQKKLINSVKACPSMTVDLPDETLGFQLSKEEKDDRPVQDNDKKPSMTSLMAD